jgi:uncharacterized protein (DUF111 family)
MRKEKISEISVSINDMTGEEIGFVLNLAMDEGAMDAYAMPVFKRNQHPAHVVTLLCGTEETVRFCELLLRHSSAFDLRVTTKYNLKLDRKMDIAESSFGVVRYYHAGEKIHIEYEDLARIAKRTGMSIAAIRERILGEIKL